MQFSPAGRDFNLQDYIGIARPDHWIKNVFMVPGFAAAFALAQAHGPELFRRFAVGLVSLCLIASANYTINEFLDARFDRHHPVKRLRAGARGVLDPRLVTVQYVVLAAFGLGLGALVNAPFFWCSCALLLMGLIYNVEPLRSKDKIYLDVLSESINNPLRFLLGWFVAAPMFVPPGSALLAYWMGGAFLMAIKRYAEYRSIGDPARAGLYRKSFVSYSEQSLLLSSFFYALCSAFFIAVFLMKYRIELVMTAPLFALLFTSYLSIGTRDNSAAQAPEKLYKETSLLLLAAVTFISGILLFFVDIPVLRVLTEQQMLPIHGQSK